MIKVFKEIGYDGKERLYVPGSGYYKKIYRQRKSDTGEWINKLKKLLYDKKYDDIEIREIIIHCLKRRYYISNSYYIKPSSIVQRILELGYENLEYL